jgi:hypothetical protein
VTPASFHPLVIQTFWSHLISTVDQQAAALIRTPFTPSVPRSPARRPESADRPRRPAAEAARPAVASHRPCPPPRARSGRRQPGAAGQFELVDGTRLHPQPSVVLAPIRNWSSACPAAASAPSHDRDPHLVAENVLHDPVSAGQAADSHLVFRTLTEPRTTARPCTFAPADQQIGRQLQFALSWRHVPPMQEPTVCQQALLICSRAF